MKNSAKEDIAILDRFSSEEGLKHRIGWLQQKIMRLFESYHYAPEHEMVLVIEYYANELQRLQKKLARFTNAKKVQPCFQS